MKLDGTEKTKLTEDDTKIDVSKGGSFEVYTDAIAYVDSSSRHVLISKEGKYLQDSKQIKGKIVDVVGDNIFYLDSDKALYRTQLASDKTEKIMDLKSDTIVEINSFTRFSGNNTRNPYFCMDFFAATCHKMTPSYVIRANRR